MTHTPGPYGYQELPESTIVDGYGTEVCFEVHEIEDGEPASVVAFVGNESQAHLLAAAPDLRAALIGLWAFASEMVEKHGMNGDDTMTDVEHRNWQQAAGATSAALYKAEGRE